MEIKDRKPLFLIPIVLIIFFVLHLVGPNRPLLRFYLNLSPSEPEGLYLAVPFAGQLKKMDYVLIAPPENAVPYIYGRGWLPENRLLLKNVYALPGDHVQITNRAIYINHRYVGPIKEQDSTGLPLPRLRGSIPVPANYFLPIADRNPNSFDGRYFGPVSNRQIRFVVKPFLIWGRKASQCVQANMYNR